MFNGNLPFTILIKKVFKIEGIFFFKYYEISFIDHFKNKCIKIDFFFL